MTEEIDRVTQHMNRQVRMGDPAGCDWESPEGDRCALERHDGEFHATLPAQPMLPGMFKITGDGQDGTYVRTTHVTDEQIEALEPPPERGVRPCGLDQQHVLYAVPGLSYRQLDYWTRKHWLNNHRHSPIDGEPLDRARGSGKPGCWPYPQVALAGRMYALTELGFEVSAAYLLASNREALRLASRRLLDVEADLIARSGMGPAVVIHPEEPVDAEILDA